MTEISVATGAPGTLSTEPLGESDSCNRKGSLVTIGGGEGGESLQERFARFRKERQRERTLARRSAKAAAAGGGAERDVEQLRKKFVDACLSYIGVPYSKKSHQPDDPDYNAPLFLDCCALIRRAVKDLQEDFGFNIGRWNQAYQFETLPTELTFDQMRPGDIIFVEGKYFAPGKIPQKHDMVHVEVFIGGETGEATVGSRWSKNDPAAGKVRGVQIHPTYYYESKNYEIKKYHFRSLDTWLNGVCRSQTFGDAICPTTLPQGIKSIFDAEGDDEDASGDEAENSGPFVPNPYRAAPVYYVSEGNNWKALAQALETRGWQRLPFEWSSTHKFDLKWCECRGSIDYARHVEGQLVNHIPNNDVITAKAKMVETLREHEASTGEKFIWSPNSYLSERASDRLAALAEAEASPDSIWILKPSRGLGGKGIELIQGCAALRERLFPQEQQFRSPMEGWVIQRYVDKPLLLQGRKFDIRVYCCIARTAPKHLWFFHPGYCKVALEPYSVGDLSDDQQRFAHLTNACVQRSHPDYKDCRGQHIWSLEQAEAEIRQNGHWQNEEGTLWPHLHQEMKKVIGHLYRASVGSLQRKAGYFDLLGLDFMLDESLNLHLLEVNSNPAMFFDSSPVLEELVPRLLGSAVDLVLEAQRPEIMATSQVPTAPSPYELVVDENSDFCFGK
eukprot:TRINITY_DN27694_c0_g1_i1.p1 TRINITY_DN27694_c0_g1~~TRINITY_DN27694_c0_g1_i1.p1  ORF type:complete len:674 (-),score=137.73 TRINITY_DN27694_c0_g1_i1:79-2100(-)